MPKIITTNLFKFLLVIGVFFSMKSTFSQSKKVWLYQADHNYSLTQYPTALHYYYMVIDDTLGLDMNVLPYEVQLTNQKLKKSGNDSTKTVSVEDYVNHQIAMCYRYSHDYERAASNFKQTAENGSYPDDYYYYGSALMSLGDYSEALTVFETYQSMDGTSDYLVQRSLQDMTSCIFALKLVGDQKKIDVTLADTAIFNKGTSSFGVTYWGGDNNKVVFSSAREYGVIIDPETQDSEYLLDLYWTEKTDDWEKAKNFGRPLNSSNHDASGSFGDKNAIYFTRWSAVDSSDKHIFVAREFNLRFFESQKLDSTVNVEGYQSINPYITPNGKWMYFSSDKPGGIGGMDIWKVEIDSAGNPKGESFNLGKPVNTEYDDVTPFYHAGFNTLYFSSDGHDSYGGLDVFKSSYDEDLGEFRSPKNMGNQINTEKDESYFILDDILNSGFLSSDRDNCLISDTVYNLCASCYHIYEVDMPDLEFKLSGYVYDENTNEVIPNAKVEFKDISFQWEHFSMQTDDNGYYEHDLIMDLELFMKATKTDYFADAGLVSTIGMTESKSFTQDFYLDQIPKGEITIQGIEYDFDKATLRPESKLILDSLIVFLELNSNISIEIRSHTDQRGNDDYNLSLSERRAKSVVDYLVEHGIAEERLVSKGYGETTPAEVPNKEGEMVTMTQEYIDSLPTKKLKTEAYQRNRRTAFKVMSQDGD